MQQEPHHNNTYSAADIERYLSGRMSAEEMHLLEKAALDDPFLADALEGYAGTPTPAEDAASLQQKLQQRLAGNVVAMQPRPSKYRFIRIAAMILVIAAAGWFVYRLTGMGSKDIALHQPDMEKETTTAADTVTTIVPPPAEKAAATEPVTAQTARTKQKPDNGRSIKKTATADQPTASVPSAFRSDQAAAPVLETYADSPVDVQQQAMSRKAAAETSITLITNTHVFRGRVTDSSNKAVPYAVINDRKRNIATTTDAEGHFSIATPDSTLDVAITSAGYEKKETVLQQATSNNVVLQPSGNALNEVVIAGKKAPAKAVNRTPRITVEEAEPAAGWPHLEQYLEENLTPPNAFITPMQQGAVKLSFDVNAKGEAVNIKVDQSLCTPCDAAAIRVLQGPKWQQKKHTRARARIEF